METFAQRLRKARKRLAMSQQTLAGRLHLDRTAVTHWENDRTTPSPEQLAKLSVILGVSADYLIGLNKSSWIEELPAFLEDFIREEVDSANPVYLHLAWEIKSSGVNPAAIRAFIVAMGCDKERNNK